MLHVMRASRPITIQLLTEFIHEHTGLVADNDAADGEEGGVVRSEWEEMGWRLWQYSEKERQKLEADNRQLAEQLNMIAEERASGQQQQHESSDVMDRLESLLNRVLDDETTPTRTETTPTLLTSQSSVSRTQ